METERKIYSLSDLARSLRSVIERHYASTYWVKAEVAKLNHYPRSGHCYPDLVEKSGEQILAQMRATIWAGDYKITNQNFIRVTGEPLSEGMAILFQSSVTYHPVYGLSLQIHQIEPSFTLGQMAFEKQKTIERLKAEGIFDLNKSLEMPLLPRRLAIVSVETSKGYHDFLKILSGYRKQFTLWHHLFPALLQGDKAVESLTAQLRQIRKKAHLFDLVAIIRGGGGDIGLSCYDHYTLTREIANFPLPVITGIGHATNETIAEMVAWENKVTPTDVAYFVLGRFTAFDDRVRAAQGVLTARSQETLSDENQHLMRLGGTLRSFSAKILQKDQYMLTALLNRLQTGTKRFVEKETRELSHRQERIKLLDPDHILKRGFSITLLNGKSIKNEEEVRPGDLIVTRLFEGSIESQVQLKKKDHDG
ncbi:MAG: exodeoxyribonuclease VII large subunit [Bacteroides sp.]|jgi:exodeoxyribonuclease VII large subunit|nr:exodeoxyribonuclease VII large subunit [Bacteroides sp.]